MEDVDILNGHWGYFTAIWYILGQFIIFYAFGIFFRLGMLYREKSGNPERQRLIIKTFDPSSFFIVFCLHPSIQVTDRQNVNIQVVDTKM
jgi:hypothetical protein